jgi:glucokinase
MYASGRGIVMSYREAEARAKQPGAPGATEVTSSDIYQAARDGEPLAIAVMHEMGRALGIGIANLINIFNPEMVVIGGGVKEAWPLFIEAVRDEVRKRAFEYPAERTQIVPSVLGDDAGMVGAAAVALQKAVA